MSSFYTQPGAMTSLGRHAAVADGLPADAAGVARVVQGLMIHEFWLSGYGVTMTDEERDTVNLRRAEQLLDAIVGRDDRPLDVAREPGARTATNCRGFTVLAVALLRAKGVPARARCGFGAYFTEGFFEDHWVAEYFDEGRWKLIDAQIDSFQAGRLKIDFDLTDVPHDRFVIAGDAWQQVRAGEADPNLYGLSSIKESGDWWIAANVMRDAAALRNIELLPWDLWGVMPEPSDPIDEALFDELATATLSDEDRLPKLMEDDRLRVPAEVFNVQHRRQEPI
jgi:hypothetical protein